MALIEKGQVTGLLGSVVAVRGKNVQILRSAPRKRGRRKGTLNQLKNQNRFTSLANFWSRFRYTLVQRIWKIADEGGRGINLFIKTNRPAFGDEGQLLDPSRLHLTAGSLPLPHRLTAFRSPDNPANLIVSWDNTPETGSGRSDDQLMLMAVKDGDYSALLDTGAVRKAGSAVIPLLPGMETAQAVYLSFGSAKRGMYSEDMFFGI